MPLLCVFVFIGSLAFHEKNNFSVDVEARDDVSMWWKATPAVSRAARLLGPLRRHLSGAPPSLRRRFVALWGNGDYGRLGFGDLGSRWRPAICSFLSDDDDLPVSVACGGAHTLFLTGTTPPPPMPPS